MSTIPDEREYFHIPLSLRRDGDSTENKLEHQISAVMGRPCSCCTPLLNPENYRGIFENDFGIYHHSELVKLLRREGEGYYHMETNRAWEYFKKGLVTSLMIENTRTFAVCKPIQPEGRIIPSPYL